MTGTRTTLALTLGLLAQLAVAPHLRAQGVDEPSMPEAPPQFKLSAGFGAQFWETTPERGEFDDHVLGGLQIERTLTSYLALFFGTSFSTTSVTKGGSSLDLTQYLLDFGLQGRLDVGPFRQARVIPLITVSVGAAVQDPSPDGLPTRSQTALAAGVGLEYAFARTFGVQAEWRRYFINVENTFEPTDRESVTVDANRVSASVYWRF